MDPSSLMAIAWQSAGVLVQCKNSGCWTQSSALRIKKTIYLFDFWVKSICAIFLLFAVCPKHLSFHLQLNVTAEDFFFHPKKHQNLVPDRERTLGKCNATLGGVERFVMTYLWLVSLNWLTNAFPHVQHENPPQLNGTLPFFLICVAFLFPRENVFHFSGSNKFHSMERIKVVIIGSFCLLPSVLNLFTFYIWNIFRWAWWRCFMVHGVEHMLSEQNIYYSGNCGDLDSIFYIPPWKFQSRVLQKDDPSFLNIYQMHSIQSHTNGHFLQLF